MKLTRVIDFGRGKVAKNRTLLAAMTNKQSNADGTLLGVNHAKKWREIYKIS